MPNFPVYIINAFTRIPATSSCGNPAAVILLSAEEYTSLSDDIFQSLAKQFNLSETAFVTETKSPGKYLLRWFTPNVEVDLCGHATLAAAAALLEHGWASWNQQVVFETRKAGDLKVNLANERISMRFPELEAAAIADEQLEEKVLAGLKIEKERVEGVMRSKFDAVVVVKADDDVRGLSVDLTALKELEEFRGFIVASRGNGITDGKGAFVSRFFAPRVGIEEDAVTGSAHCVLASVFLKVGEYAEGIQMSERGGVVKVERLEGGIVELEGGFKVIVRGHVEV